MSNETKATKHEDEEAPTRQIAIRLPVAVLERLEAHTTRLQQKNPGLSVTRADALRTLLIDALESVETKEAERPTKTKK